MMTQPDSDSDQELMILDDDVCNPSWVLPPEGYIDYTGYAFYNIPVNPCSRTRTDENNQTTTVRTFDFGNYHAVEEI